MLKIHNGTIYYIAYSKSGYAICRFPKVGDPSLIASKIKTKQEVDKIIEEDAKNATETSLL